jgi:hypothetical protein
MKNCDENQTANLAGASRPRWRKPRLSCESIVSLTGNDNPPGAPFDGYVGVYVGTLFHENS